MFVKWETKLSLNFLPRLLCQLIQALPTENDLSIYGTENSFSLYALFDQCNLGFAPNFRIFSCFASFSIVPPHIPPKGKQTLKNTKIQVNFFQTQKRRKNTITVKFSRSTNFNSTVLSSKPQSTKFRVFCGMCSKLHNKSQHDWYQGWQFYETL